MPLNTGFGTQLNLPSRQKNPKTAAFAGLGFHARSSAHTGGGLADDSQADAGSRIVLFVSNALEHAENAALIFGRDANAVVLDPNANVVAGGFRPHAHIRANTLGNKLYRIIEQIGKALA